MGGPLKWLAGKGCFSPSYVQPTVSGHLSSVVKADLELVCLGGLSSFLFLFSQGTCSSCVSPFLRIYYVHQVVNSS